MNLVLLPKHGISFLASVAFTFLIIVSNASAQDSYNVGDKIRFEVMRKKATGTVSKVLSNGIYKVDVDKGNDRFLPSTTLVRQANVLGKVDSDSVQPKNKRKKSASKSEASAKPMADSGVRMWRDNTGNHKIEGAFVDLIDGQVKLKAPDGSPISVPLARLNPNDSKLAESLKSEMSEDNPFAGGVMPSDTASNEPSFTIREMDFSKAKGITAALTDNWNVKPIKAKPIAVPDATKLYPIEISGRRKIIRDLRTPNRIYIGNRKLLKRVEEGLVVDLATGKTLGPFTYPMKNVRTIAFDSKSNQLLTATSTGERTRPKTVDVWRINGNDVEHKFGFVASDKKIVLPVQSGMFLDDERVLLTIFGQAGIFNLNTMKAETGFQFFSASVVVTGPNGKYLYGRVDDKTAIFDVEAKKTVGTLDQLLQITNNFGFNESMTRVAFTEAQRLVIYDLVEGREIEQVILPFQVAAGRTPIFLDDENILLTRSMGASLVNLRLKSPIWSFRGPKFESVPGTNKILAIGKKSGSESIGFVDMPGKAAKDFIAATTLEELTVMPRGSAVSIRDIKSSAKQEIQNQLESNGYQVANDAPFEFRSKVTKGEKTSRTYRDVTGGADETVTMQSESYELALYKGDEKIWFRTGGSGSTDPGMFVQLNEGESVQSRANQGKGSADGFFSSLLLPDVFVKTPDGYHFGTSTGLDDF